MTTHPDNQKPGDIIKAVCASADDVTGKKKTAATSPNAFAATLRASAFAAADAATPKEGAPGKAPSRKLFDVGQCFRMQKWKNLGGFRVWQVMAHNAGGMNEEDFYEITSLDLDETETLRVPCIILESHPAIQRL